MDGAHAAHAAHAGEARSTLVALDSQGALGQRYACHLSGRLSRPPQVPHVALRLCWEAQAVDDVAHAGGCLRAGHQTAGEGRAGCQAAGRLLGGGWVGQSLACTTRSSPLLALLFPNCAEPAIGCSTQLGVIASQPAPPLPLCAVAAMLRRHGYRRCCVVGHSYGTFVASRLCQLHPEVGLGLV